jgi:diamine N-acetyltransferase
MHVSTILAQHLARCATFASLGEKSMVKTAAMEPANVSPIGTSGMHIRPAVAQDIPKLLLLYRELEETHRLHHPDLFAVTITRAEKSVERSLADAGVGFFVADFETAGVGAFVRVVDTQTPEGGVLLSRRFGLVDELVVSPEYRRSGVASLLITAAEQWATEREIPALEVNVWAFNQAAQNLYAGHGFSPLRHYLRKSLIA